VVNSLKISCTSPRLSPDTRNRGYRWGSAFNVKLLVRLIIIVLGAYLLMLTGFFGLMLLPPTRFAKAISHVPEPLFAVLPLEPLWLLARAGHLKVGAAAPDFDLPTLDNRARVRLSSFRGEKPVVLVFGSYT